jgi:hypothetical protein
MIDPSMPEEVEPDDELEQDEDPEGTPLLLVSEREEGGIAINVRGDALTPGQWGIALGDVVRMIAYSAAFRAGDDSPRRQAEVFIKVRRFLLAELDRPTDDLTIL